MYNAGDFQGAETVMIPFNTFSSDDPSVSVTVTDFANTDVYIYKDASLTERASSAGVAVDIDVETGTGSHWVSIDLSDNTDAGFYASGSQYIVRIEGVTVDAGTLNAWIGGFTIGKTQTAMTAALVAHNLDHLALTATAAADMTTEVADNTILSRILANGDTSAFDPSTDGLQPLHDGLSTKEQLADQVWDEVASGHVGAGTFGAQAGTDIDAILVDTAVIGALGAGLTAVPWNATWDAEVQSECQDALIAANLDHLMVTATAAADMSAEISASTVMARMLSTTSDVSSYVPTTDSLQSIRDVAPHGSSMVGTDGANTTVPDAAGTAATLLGAAGSALSAVPWNASWDAEVESEVDDALGGGTGTALTAVPWNSSWDTEVQSEVTDVVGIAGSALSSMPWNASWDAEVQSEVVDGLNATNAILTDTDELQIALTDGGRLDVLIDAIKAKTDNLPGSAARAVQLAGLTFMMVDATDGYTAETSATVTAQISKDGGALATCTNSVTEIGNGLYKITLTATEMTATVVTLRFTATGCRTTVMTLLTDT